MSLPKENSGAKAAFRGFRIQTIYILYRILTQETNEVFIPEGEEDLLITKDEKPIEVVQVKNYSSNLILSNLSPEKNDAFFNRSIKLLHELEKPKIKLVSFGQLGDELKKYQQKGTSDSIRKKLEKHGFEKKQIDLLFSYWKIETFDEQEILQKIKIHLNEHITGIDWETAFDLLMYWLYIASEEKQDINRDSLLLKIQSIGKFVSERYAFLTQFGTSIIDIEKNNEGIEERYLEREFYNGAAAKYAHIKANLDVLRTSKLEEIEECFNKSNLTIIHGASGQGKSALSYRYIYENYPAGFAFQVKYFEHSDLKDILAALKTLSKPFEKPFLIYIDVQPNKYHWIKLVNELTTIENCQILISIREEDLNRSPNIEEWVNPAMLQLNFFEKEAKEIFDSLEERRTIEQFLNFDEAWQTFGGKGPLLEFAYMVNQGKKLKHRLENQVSTLKQTAKQNNEWEQVELLKLVALANKYDCRIDLKKVIKQVKLKDYNSTLQWFQDEYLFRKSEDGSWLEGLHPIRSTIIANLLYDFEVEELEEVFENLIHVVKEEDLGLLLLHYFADFESDKPIIKLISNYQTTSWTNYASVLESVIWLGIKKYIRQNENQFKELKTTGVGLTFLVKPPFYQGNVEFLDFITEKMDDETRKNVDEIRGKISDNQDVFHDARYWLESSILPLFDSCNEDDISNFGKILFWLHQFQIYKEINFSAYNFDDIFERVPTKYSAAFLCGLYFYSKETRKLWYENKDKFFTKFRIEYNIPVIEENEERIKVNFIYKIDDNNNKSDSGKNSFHERAISLINISRLAIPNKQKYGSQGYGHKMTMIELPYDGTFKDMGVEHLPFKWLTKYNSIFHSLIQYDDRPDAWADVAKILYKNRQRVLDLFQSFINAMIKYYKTGKLKEIEDYWRSYKGNWYNEDLKFPKEATDKWGFTSDNSPKKDKDNGLEDTNKNTNNKKSSLDRIYPTIKTIKDFQQHLSNFFQQSNEVIVFKILTHQYSDKQIRENKTFFEKQGYNFQFPYLSVINLMYAFEKLTGYQSAFKKYFGKYSTEDYEKLEAEEIRTYKTMLFMWREFASVSFKKEKDILAKVQRKIVSVEKDIEKKIDSALSILKFKKSIVDYEFIEDSQRNKIWIIVYCKDFIHLAVSLQSVANGIREKLGSKVLPTVKGLVLEIDYPDFYIVPLVRDISVNGVYLEIPLFKITSQEYELITPITAKQLSFEELEYLNIDKGLDIILELTKPEELNGNFQVISLYLNYIAQMRELYKKEKIAWLLVNNLVLERVLEMRKIYNGMRNIILEVIREFSPKGATAEDILPHFEFIEILMQFAETVGAFEDFFKHIDESAEKEESISFDIVDEWNTKFQAMTESSTLIYIYWSSVILDKHLQSC